jgi:hypothetical protein
MRPTSADVNTLVTDGPPVAAVVPLARVADPANGVVEDITAAVAPSPHPHAPPRVLVTWEPTADERARIAQGENVVVVFLEPVPVPHELRLEADTFPTTPRAAPIILLS